VIDSIERNHLAFGDKAIDVQLGDACLAQNIAAVFAEDRRCGLCVEWRI